MIAGRLITTNPELLTYSDSRLHITVLGGIRLSGLDRLKVTLKITIAGKPTGPAFRHNLDLYNSIQLEQLTEKASETLDISAVTLMETIDGLITALEAYRACRLEGMKPKSPEKKELSEAERKAAITFLKSKDLLKRTREMLSASGIVDEEENSLIAFLVYSSRKRTVPLHLMFLGSSG